MLTPAFLPSFNLAIIGSTIRHLLSILVKGFHADVKGEQVCHEAVSENVRRNLRCDCAADRQPFGHGCMRVN